MNNLKQKPIECAYNLLLFPGSQCLIKAHQHGLHWPEKKSRFRIPWLRGQISRVSGVLGDHQGSPNIPMWKGTWLVPNVQGTSQSSKQTLSSVSGKTDWYQKFGSGEHVRTAAPDQVQIWGMRLPKGRLSTSEDTWGRWLQREACQMWNLPGASCSVKASWPPGN